MHIPTIKQEVLAMYRVYDKRTDETLFKGRNNIDCAMWMGKMYPIDSEDFDYIWLERVNKTHHLKILPQYFNDIRLGTKTFEIRKNDRNYKVGDTLVLKEYEDSAFTGNIVRVIVTYITDYAQQEDYIVMAIELDE